jgi:dTDP-4-amino-4,6-dideoxygalactose transaminase
MLENGIETGYHYQPNHWLDYYNEKKAAPLFLTDSIFPELLSLPLHPDLNQKDVHCVAKMLINLVSLEEH